MKILFLSPYFYPHIGGVEKHAYILASSLMKKGHSVVIITKKHNNKLKSYEEVDALKIYRFNQPKVKYLGLIYTWFWLLLHFNLIYKSDIIHCHDIFVWYLPFRLLLPNKPVFTTFHGWEGIYPIPLKNIIYKKIAAKLSKGTLAIGKYVEKYYKIKVNKISYGAVSTPKVPGSKVRNEIVYVGRLDSDTGLLIFLTVLDLLKKIKDISFSVNFCGDGELKTQCAKYGRVHGFVDPAPYLSKARFCFASGYLSILEAMANKCIILTGYDNDLKKDYYLDTPFSKWINSSNNPEILAKKIIRFYFNTKLTQNAIESGYNWIKGQTWETLLNDYLSLWKKTTAS
ncbi:hypothetical protein A3D01_05630 [Candidatus Woesebacteria bacterium RIFCSPHIGHO2_02_FULL_39_13]|uniref:Glycosyltransferase subfamily 4-like N-terminal domain-containing protein n=1 Tax=Candidatus Woesebacteria bacterium RIFCSPHIGHO2_02_FULL_39_13 TaxID=1802505 RepID=A0A1F7Z033_9BACT|nr:MAG: hypothetical protein A3D01_05630 [Candidatus Woesebacteria bacterium RIFCSPHIGHO2_02_FULL_39_13]OGM36938.1 MAG: hypothetical protein A3E13_01445 [Candidatus Woesebacteria bacterium RIFCSPHIGHO2_12_FULL_40_20]OGM74578.1 MAG: hypothetical protein A3H19_00015 [Candidatus Woesebacteria bacterium RIFCSPLOWO2_12_FULL_39_9]